MDIRKIDVAMRDGWRRIYSGGYCDICIDEFEEDYGHFLEEEDADSINIADYANNKYETQICSGHFADYCEDKYRIIEEVPIP